MPELKKRWASSIFMLDGVILNLKYLAYLSCRSGSNSSRGITIRLKQAREGIRNFDARTFKRWRSIAVLPDISLSPHIRQGD
jgi:hypothetical protein